jgi:plasmid stabilization system protein ParE
MKVVYAERARRDIAGIYDSIARHNPSAARRVEDRIRAVCEGLADFPYASVETDEPNVRRAPLVRYPYTVFCRIDATRDLVEIARVVHGARVKDLGRMPDDG